MKRQNFIDHLNDKIIPFWNSLIDKENGGFYGKVDYELNVIKSADKGVILNSRILWFYSNCYMQLKDEVCLKNAKHAYKFLRDKCYNQNNGGVYWMIKCDGSVADGLKHTYNLAFAIYALSAYYEASNDKEALTLAKELYEKIENVCADRFAYREAFLQNWEPTSNAELSENGVSADKTMNTVLHILEAYTQFYRVSKDVHVKSSLQRLLNIFKTCIYNSKDGHLEVFFDHSLNSIANMHSYGHDIEAAWLIDLACTTIGEQLLEFTSTISENIYKLAFKNGAVNNERFEQHIDTTRIWWVQAEAIVGFYNAYQKSGDEKFLKAVEEIWQFVQKHIVDSRPGSEWFWSVDADGKPMDWEIAGPWKCPYHNGRMCLEMIKRLPK